MTDKTRLLDQIRDGIRRKHYSIRTEQAYVEGIGRFVLHYNKTHPRDIGAAEVEAFLTHLAVAKHILLFKRATPYPGPAKRSGTTSAPFFKLSR